MPYDPELMRRRPLRHFHWLLNNDIERDHEAENDRKEVDRQRRDVGCGIAQAKRIDDLNRTETPLHGPRQIAPSSGKN
jgi:hypothetical protein